MNELAFSTRNRRCSLDCQTDQRTRATATRTTARGSTMNETNRAFYEAQLKAEVAVLTEMVRVLSDKLAQMEAKND